MNDGRSIRSWRPPNVTPNGHDRNAALSAYPGIGGVRRVSWGALPLGAVILDGPLVAGALPPELRDFPVVDRPLREELYRRYHFRADHLVTIASAIDRLAAQRFARDVEALDRRIRAAQPLSREVIEQYSLFGIDHAKGVGDDPRLTETDRLVKDHYNSFAVPTGREGPIPTLIRGDLATDISTARIITGLLTGEALLPRDESITLHLALDVSFSMKRRGRLPHGLAAINQLARRIPAVMPGTRFRGYHFSDRVREVSLPADRAAVPAEGTRQAELFRTVLRRTEGGRRNMLVLVTDGEPSDLADTSRAAQKMRAAALDYMQILLHTDEDLRHEVQSRPGEYLIKDNMIADEEVDEDRIVTLSEEVLGTRRESRFDQFTRVAEIAGGNQVVLTEFAALGLVTVEIYDRYVGLLSLV